MVVVVMAMVMVIVVVISLKLLNRQCICWENAKLYFLKEHKNITVININGTV